MPIDSAPAPTSTLASTSPTGSQFQPVYMSRKMKIFPVYESDLESLEVFSLIVTIALAVESLLLGFVMQIVWDAAVSPADSSRRTYGFAVVILVGVFAIGAGIVIQQVTQKKTAVRKRIEQESREIASL